MAIGQKHIAENLGVSIALVSRVLSGQAREIGIAEKTIERVEKMAKELGYVPNVAALSLKGKPTNTIGVAVYDFNDPFFGALINQIQIQAHEHNYSIMLAGFLNRIPDDKDLQPLHKYAIDGLIVLGSEMEANWLQRFQHMPVVRIGHGNPEEGSLRVVIDEEDAARQLIQHLHAQGHHNLTCISGPVASHRLRQAAMEKEAHRLGLNMRLVSSAAQNSFAAGREVSKLLSELIPSTDVFVCISDRIAMGVLHALNDAGVKCPEQIAVTGFDDIPAGEQFIPSITTIRQPFEAMVECAFHAITDSSQPVSSGITVFPGTMIVRQTA